MCHCGANGLTKYYDLFQLISLLFFSIFVISLSHSFFFFVFFSSPSSLTTVVVGLTLKTDRLVRRVCDTNVNKIPQPLMDHLFFLSFFRFNTHNQQRCTINICTLRVWHTILHIFIRISCFFPSFFLCFNFRMFCFIFLFFFLDKMSKFQIPICRYIFTWFWFRSGVDRLNWVSIVGVQLPVCHWIVGCE